MRILLLDVYSIAHQIPKSMLKLTTSSGKLSGHIYSYLRTLKSINSTLDFSAVFSILDGGHTSRDVVDNSYKGNRVKKSGIIEDIIPILNYLPGFVVHKPGFEADDLIYTLCTLLHKEFDITIVSKDYDISYNLIYYPKVKHFFNVSTEITTYSLFMHYGCTPEKLPLYKAIYGDKSDNISSLKLPRKISETIKTMFYENKNVKKIGKLIPKECKKGLLKNLKLTRPIFISEFSLSEIKANGSEINTVLNNYEIKSIIPQDIIIFPKQSNKIISFLLNGK